VLSLFGTGDVPTLVDGIPHTLSSTAAAILTELAPEFECVWCTGWEDRADEHLPHLLGLPRGWGHLTFPHDPVAEAHWKLAAIEAYTGAERAVAWIDDAHDDTCEAWAARRPGRTLLIGTDPAVGITDAHVTRLLGWASAASG
jgi:hypothetical protein